MKLFDRILADIRLSLADLKTDYFYRTGSKVAGLAFAFLIWLFIFLPGISYRGIDIPGYMQMFGGSILIDGVVYSLSSAFYSAIGYFLVTVSGVLGFLFVERKANIVSVTLAVCGFVLIACQPLESLRLLLSLFPNQIFTYDSGYLLPLGFSLGNIVVQAMLLIYKPKRVEKPKEEE